MAVNRLQFATLIASFLSLAQLAQAFVGSQVTGPCPIVAPGLYGDFRYDEKCQLGTDEPIGFGEDKMRPFSRPPAESRVKPGKQPEWLVELSKQLLESTLKVNNLYLNEEQGISTESCGESCVFTRSSSPQCCQVETRVVYPMFGRSISTGKFVRIVQEDDPHGVLQPIVYRHCRSENASIVRGRCHQSTLPRFLYVKSETITGHPYRQELLWLPNSCDCIVSLTTLAEEQSEQQKAPISPESKPSLHQSRSFFTSYVEDGLRGSGDGSGNDSLQPSEDSIAIGEDMLVYN